MASYTLCLLKSAKLRAKNSGTVIYMMRTLRYGKLLHHQIMMHICHFLRAKCSFACHARKNF